MSLGTRVPFTRAYQLAHEIAAELRPVAAEAKAVGSLRRRAHDVADVEFLVRPRTVVTDLFGGERPYVEPIRRLAETWGRVRRGGEKEISVVDAKGSGIDVQLYVVTPPANWYALMAIRTGPADLSKHAVTLMRSRGLAQTEGRVVDIATQVEVPIESEEAWFAAAGLPYFPPHLRDTDAARIPVGGYSGRNK